MYSRTVKSINSCSKVHRNSLISLYSSGQPTSLSSTLKITHGGQHLSTRLPGCVRFSSNSSSPASLLDPRRGFKTDSKNNQAAMSSSSVSSYPAIRDDPLFPTVMSPSLYTSSSWSSPYDSVPRHQFLKDYSHLLTLLEACLETENFARAESVLVSFSEHTNPKGIAMAVNKYLLRLADTNKSDSSVAYSWVASISKKIPSFKPDSITYAILLKNKCVATNYNFDIKTYLRQHSTAVLKHVDVLGIGMIAKIAMLAEVPLSAIDPQFRDVIAQTIAASSESKAQPAEATNTNTAATSEPAVESVNAEQEDTSKKLEEHEKHQDFASVIKTLRIDDITSLSKPGTSEIQSVESYGLKAIKHSLSGFVTDEKAFSTVIDTISPYVAEKSIDSKNYTDFFKLCQELEASNATEEQKAEFYKQFESYNWARQKAIERKGLESASLKWKYAHDQMRQAGALSIKPLEALFWEWNLSMQPLLEQELARISETLNDGVSKSNKKAAALRKKKAAEKALAAEQNKDLELVEDENDESLDLSVADRFQYGPYLLLVKPQKLAVITILELFKLVSTGGIQEGMKTARAVLSVGKAVEAEFKSAQASARERNIYKGSKAETQNRDTMMAIQDQVKSSELGSTASWPSEIRAKIGSLLISLLIHVAKVPVVGKNPITGEEVRGKAPAFYHGYQYQGGTRVGVLKVHKYLSKFVSGDKPTKILQPQLLPMLVKPQPWTSWRTGGYLYSANSVMRVKDAPEQQAYLKAASEQGNLDRVYEGLNVLGNTAWTVNTEVFEVVSKVWNKNKEFLDIPKDPGDLVLPPQPDRAQDPQVRRAWLRECRKVSNDHTSQYSQRCTINYKLEIARAFLGERFYFPHNMDFRGRAYPLSPHLNHLGDDLSRGLLKFWQGRRLGKSGLKWLKIHTANVFGYDKFSFEERENFIDRHLGEVYESAENPLGGEAWWQQGADPWQTLAACIELTNAMSMTNPEDYVSHLPVHQDGTCNGLQHYAALGGDIEGARQVNLVPSDRPQDIYSKVLEIVQLYVNEDAKQGLAIAELLKDKLVRKVVKQTVMTTVYGVTFIGARAQIASQLKEKEGIDESNIYQCSMYLTRKVFLAVRSLFEGAHLIQDWLGDSASKIAKCVRLDIDTHNKRNGNRPDFMSSVIWTTPLGLPIVQPYRETRKIQISTKLQTVQLADPYAMRAVNARKQKTAFPPNYIHSLDASHMLLSAAECGRQELDFASVHDSYWTHAADVDKMNAILRNAFISLHKVDLVAQLQNEFTQRYGGMLEFVKIPRNSSIAERVIEARKNLVLQKRRELQHDAATTTASKPKLRSRVSPNALTAEEEIAIERERLTLLGSSNPDEVARGEAMVTPFSIMDELSDEEIKELISEASSIKPKKKNKNLIKSTEHSGSGLDRQLESEMGEENLVSAEDAESTASSSSDASVPTLDDSLVGQKSDSTIGVFIRLKIDQVPPKGDFDVHDLTESKYFFS